MLCAGLSFGAMAQDNTPFSTIPDPVGPDTSGSSEIVSGFDQTYDFVLEQPIPEVLSTTQLRQPKSRVPGTTTVIQGN